MVYTIWQLSNDECSAVKFLQGKHIINTVIFVHKSIYWFWSGTVAKENEDIHIETWFQGFSHSFKNCCLIYILLVCIHRFLWIKFKLIYIVSACPWHEKIIRNFQQWQIIYSTCCWLCNEIICEFPLNFVFNNIIIIFIKLLAAPPRMHHRRIRGARHFA